MKILLDHYHTLCQSEHLQEDAAQIEGLHKLEALKKSLKDGRLFLKFWRQKNPVTGLYIYGSVGLGKSMIMDLFYKHLQGVIKKRYHFHEFMLMVHAEIKVIMERAGENKDHPMAQIAVKLAHESRVICFDEFHVKDITDTMILKRLMGFLWEEGVVLSRRQTTTLRIFIRTDISAI